MSDNSQYQKNCNPYKCKVNYPNPKTCYNPYRDNNLKSPNCRPFGYQPTLPNPGGLKFSIYSYPYQLQDGDKHLSHPGMGWYKYQQTGEYSTWW